MIKKYKQIVGNKVIVRLDGDTKQEIVRDFWRYINFGKSVKIRRGIDIENDDAGLTWIDINENESAYFSADLNEFIKTLINIQIFDISERFDDKNEKVPDELIKKCQEKGLKIFNDIEESNILRPNEDVDYVLA